MMKLRVALVFGLLVVFCLSMSPVQGEEPQAEPEKESASAEPEAEPEHNHDHHDKSKSGEAKAATGKNAGSSQWSTVSVPTIVTLAVVAKLCL